VLDHLRVVVGGEVRLPLAAVGERHEADEVGEPGERRALEVGVLVQEVVDVPRLVADDEVVLALLNDLAEDHEVVDQDLVHVPERLERVQVVLAAGLLEVAGLVRQRGRSRVHLLAVPSQERVDGGLGEPVQLQVRPALAQRAGDTEVATGVPQPDRGRQEQGPGRPRGRRAPARRARR
jgi:hypothetical protein